MAFVYDLTDTWNAGGTTFNAIKMNVTDTASAAASKLITVQVGGAEKFGVRKDGLTYVAGSLGVGTSSPSYRLDIPATGAVAANLGGILTGANGTDIVGTIGPLSLQASGANYVGFTTASTERMRITGTGNVGIGTSSPGTKLTVNGGAEVGVAGGTSTAFGQKFWPIAAGNSVFNIYADVTQMRFTTGGSYDHTANTSLMVLTNTGNVGIGTSSPNTQLTVEGSACEVAINDSAGSIAGLRFRTSGSTKGVIQADSTSNLRFSSGATERMRIDSSGRVGIGTTAPDKALTISASDSQIRLYDADGTNQFASIQSDNGTAKITSRNNTSNGTIAFQRFDGTAVSESMRIDSSGNLLVGTTSAISSSKFALVGGLNTHNMLVIKNTDTQSGGQLFQLFLNSAGDTAGSIGHSGTTAVSYNTSSDYRLKDIDGPVANSGAYIDALKPVQGSWKADGSRFIGLLAHEVQEVSETQIATGEKDGEEMQAMDYSSPELIANLIAEIQSLRARVAQLEGN